MKKLSKGDVFKFDYRNWTVLQRHGNYLLLRGDLAGSRPLYTAAPVRMDDNTEVCRPYLSDINPDSSCYSLEKIAAMYEAECAKIDAMAAAKEKAAEIAAGREQSIKEKTAKRLEAQGTLQAAKSELQSILNNGKPVSKLVKDKKTIELINSIKVCETILNLQK
jgi:hypothetical protein